MDQATSAVGFQSGDTAAHTTSAGSVRARMSRNTPTPAGPARHHSGAGPQVRQHVVSTSITRKHIPAARAADS
jgi:hypothetical protein